VPVYSVLMIGVPLPQKASGRNVCSRPVSLGAYTRTRLEVCRGSGEQLPWTVSSALLATWVGAKVIGWPLVPERVAGAPICWPVSYANDTPGNPDRVQAAVPALRRIRWVIWWPPPGELPPTCSARWAAVQCRTAVAAGAGDAP